MVKLSVFNIKRASQVKATALLQQASSTTNPFMVGVEALGGRKMQGEPKRNLKCTQGHILQKFDTDHSGYYCDNCRKNILKGSLLFGCWKCNMDVGWDMCEGCQRQVLGQHYRKFLQHQDKQEREDTKPKDSQDDTWACAQCTFVNTSDDQCEMCQGPRPACQL